MPKLKDAAIAWLARCWRTRFPLLIVVLAGLGTAHILVRTATEGAVIDGGAVYFLSTASNFLAGEGWRYFTGSPMVGWPAASDGVGGVLWAVCGGMGWFVASLIQ